MQGAVGSAFPWGLTPLFSSASWRTLNLRLRLFVNDLREELGLEILPFVFKKRKYTKNQIKKMLISAYKRKGKQLTDREVGSSKTLPATATILRYFRTTRMSKVWEEVIEGIKQK